MGKGLFTMKLEGDADLKKLFRSAPKKIINRIARVEIKDAVRPMQQDAKSQAPVDEGDLRKAIVVRAGRRSRRRISREVRVEAKKLKRTGDHPKRVAGLFQEEGTKHHKEQPFMRPAFRRHWKAAARKITRGIKAKLAQEAAKAHVKVR